MSCRLTQIFWLSLLPYFCAGATVDFLHDVKPLLSRLGCNGASCHGKAEGQNGFKLSVFGNDPEGDFRSIIKEGRGRRISQAAPEDSLSITISSRSP